MNCNFKAFFVHQLTKLPFKRTTKIVFQKKKFPKMKNNKTTDFHEIVKMSNFHKINENKLVFKFLLCKCGEL